MLSLILLRILHIAVLGFILSGPFLREPALVFLFIIGVPFMALHWVLNNDTCVLTEAEMYLTGSLKRETFFFQLISPFYNANKNSSASSIYFITVLLYFFTVIQVVKNYDKYKEYFSEVFETLKSLMYPLKVPSVFPSL